MLKGQRGGSLQLSPLKEPYTIVVVMPVGPNTPVAFVIDTLDSFTYYTGSSFKIIIADDSQQGIGSDIKKVVAGIDVISSQKSLGGWGGLYVTLALAYRRALECYDFKAILKLDTDALVTGHTPERAALEMFAARPAIGIAGQYPMDYDGLPWDIGWPRRRILNGLTTWKGIKRPVANFSLRPWYTKAIANGYRTGESVFGGAYFLNPLFLRALSGAGLLPEYRFRNLNLGEDHLFGLLAKSLGFELGDLSSGDLPFGCAWKGLPASPENLLARDKKIIHSTRQFAQLGEDAIREWFRKRRA